MESTVLREPIEKRTKSLLRRVKRIQAKQLEQHVKKELTAFVEYHQINYSISCQNESPNEPKTVDDLKKEAPFIKRESIDEKPTTIDAESIRIAAGKLKANLKHLEATLDSDATESSSGESCDEDDLYKPYTPSYWKWLKERNARASRWTWLQAQVADLEFKIKQQNERFLQLRASKGSITFSLGNNTSTSNRTHINTSNGSTNSTTDPSSTPSKSSFQNPSSSFSSPQASAVGTSVNTPTTPNNSDVNGVDVSNNSESEVSHCARTLPLKQMRKRKLVHSSHVLSWAAKRKRYSTVPCSCSSYPSFVTPCLLCNGRYNCLQSVDADCMPPNERYTLLDPSYHPVLSLPNDVSLGLLFSKPLKKETFTKCASKLSFKKASFSSNQFSYKFGPDGKKIKRKSHAAIASAKLKRKLDSSVRKKLASRRRGISGKKSSLKDKGENGSHDEHRSDSVSPLSETSSVPIHWRRRSEQNAYDINNIVIPYSVASTTRVEKLKYKEIITPKWRYVDDTDQLKLQQFQECCENMETVIVSNNSINNGDDDGEETDEISDETFALRHQKCEIDEKTHFSSFLKNAHGSGPGRGHHSRLRLDSNRSDPGKAERSNSNSGNLTPQISGSTSIHVVEESPLNVDFSSQDSYPPYILQGNCPSPLLMNNMSGPSFICKSESPDQGPIDDGIERATHGLSARTSERHRTSSSSRLDDSRLDDSIDDDDFEEVQPYEKRTFPLSEQFFQEISQAEEGEENSITE